MCAPWEARSSGVRDWVRHHTTDDLACEPLPYAPPCPGWEPMAQPLDAGLRSVADICAGVEQPAPVPTSGAPVWHLVVADMLARDNVGRAKYGTPLQAGNGRDALRDAYEEALDLAVYLRQALAERGAR